MINQFTKNEVPEETLAWLAALIDGEGWIGLTDRKTKSPVDGRKYYRPQISIGNTNERLIKEIIERTGINRVYKTKRRGNESNNKDIYNWKIGATELRFWLPQLLPWFVCKKQQALLLMEYLLESDKSMSTTVVKSKPDYNRVNEIVNTISNLNKRGRPVNSQKVVFDKTPHISAHNSITHHDLIWLAGLIDGEGSIMLGHRKAMSNKRNTSSYRPVITISNTNTDLLNTVVSKTGVACVYNHRRTDEIRKYAYTWRLNANNLRLWLPLLTPHLVCKRRQAELLLEYLSNASINAKKGDRSRIDGNQRKAEIYAEIRSLNKRGKQNG